MIITSMHKLYPGEIKQEDIDVIGIRYYNIPFLVIKEATKIEYQEFVQKEYPDFVNEMEYFPYFYKISVD